MFGRAFLSFCLCGVIAQASFGADPWSGGGWVGEWRSQSNGHRGPIHASIRPTETGYRVLFWGRFAHLVPFVYPARFSVVGQHGDQLFLYTEQRLPLFGNFRAEAVVLPDQFQATFTSKRDAGTFRLRR